MIETMENIMPNGKLKQSATADAIFSAPLSPSRSSEKVQSRYLKPSTGSCHDYCKFGKKHNYEVASLDLRTFLKRKIKEKNEVATPNGEEKRSIVTSKSMIGVEPNKKSNTIAKTLLKSRESKQNETESLTLHDEKKRKVVKWRTWVRPESSQDHNVINSTILSPNFEVDALVDPGRMKEIAKSDRPISPVAPAAISLTDLSPASEVDVSGGPVESAPSGPISSSVRKIQTIIDQKAAHPLKRGDVAVRSAIVLKTRTPLLTPISHLKSSRSLIIRRIQDKKTTKKFEVVASKTVNTLKTTNAPLLRSISTRRNLENLSRSTNTSKTKILKPLRSIIAEKEVLQSQAVSVSSLNPGKPGNLKHSTSMKSLDHKTNDPKSAIGEGTSKEGNSSRARRTWTLRPQDNIPAPHKLKFKQGKVVDLRCDSIDARRLWFKLGRMSSDSQNGNSFESQDGNGFAQKRSFWKKDTGDSDPKVTDSESRALVLKHQDTEKKKEGQALFNHVIEETASKLVEARKGKVKALVGAFETVISLQEGKPAAVVSTV